LTSAEGLRSLPSVEQLTRGLDRVSNTVAVRAARETVAAASDAMRSARRPGYGLRREIPGAVLLGGSEA